MSLPTVLMNRVAILDIIACKPMATGCKWRNCKICSGMLGEEPALRTFHEISFNKSIKLEHQLTEGNMLSLDKQSATHSYRL